MSRRHSSVHGQKPNARAQARGAQGHGAPGHDTSQRGPSQRQLRVGEMLRHALSEVLLEGNVRDADLVGISVTVTQVIPSGDMRHATVFCEPLGGRNAGKVIAALNRHKGFLRGEMGRRITLKFTPELRFVEDETFAEAEKIANLLNSERVKKDLRGDGEDGPEKEGGPEQADGPEKDGRDGE
jgi:ribosome-binding factor A